MPTWLVYTIILALGVTFGLFLSRDKEVRDRLRGQILKDDDKRPFLLTIGLCFCIAYSATLVLQILQYLPFVDSPNLGPILAVFSLPILAFAIWKEKSWGRHLAAVLVVVGSYFSQGYTSPFPHLVATLAIWYLYFKPNIVCYYEDLSVKSSSGGKDSA